MGIDHRGTICESSGALERELGLRDSLVGRTLTESLVEGSEKAIELVLGDGASESPVVQLAFAGSESHFRTFYVVVDGQTRWLMGQPRELERARAISSVVARPQPRRETQTRIRERAGVAPRFANSGGALERLGRGPSPLALADPAAPPRSRPVGAGQPAGGSIRGGVTGGKSTGRRSGSSAAANAVPYKASGSVASGW